MGAIRLYLTPVFAVVCCVSAFACSSADEAEYDCDGEYQTDRVEASEWVRDHTDIEEYRYRSDPAADVVGLELLDADDEELGELIIEGFFGRSAEPRDDENRRVEASFEPSGDGEVLEMSSDALISNEHADEFRTRTRLVRGDVEMTVRSEFQALECYANERPEQDGGHPCAWPVPVFESAFSVPTCGFDLNPGFRGAPNVSTLEYRTGVESDPEVGGLLRTTAGDVATIEAVEPRARVGESEEIEEWLEATGTDAIIGTDAERLATAAYPDPAWMDHVEEHAAACVAEEFEQAGSELETVRQPHHGGPGFSCETDDGRLMGAAAEDVEQIQQPGGGPCGHDCADGCGKPHLRTYDGSSFPFHAAGEFTLSIAEQGASFEIQARVEPAGDLSCRDDVEACQNITVITAVAIEIGGVRIGVYRDEQPHLVVDGEPVERVSGADLAVLPEGASIHQQSPTSFRFDWPGGESLEVEVGEYYLDIHGMLPRERLGQVAGLWGNYTNITSDDFRTRDGKVVEKPLEFDEFYDEFVDSWRIDPAESLFEYDEGEDSSDFTISELPEEQVGLEDLPEELREEARSACSDVTGYPDRNWCVFDVVCMCDDELAHSTQDLGPAQSVTDMDPEAPLTATGDLCIETPENFAYRPAPERACPPTDEPCINVVREKRGVELVADLEVDAVESGVYQSGDELVDEVLEAGTEVDSYLLHLNEVSPVTGRMGGEVLFDGEILGVVATDEGLAGSDGLVGVPDTVYSDKQRAPELEAEEFEILEGADGVGVQFDSADGLTEIRVVTRTSE